MKLILTLAIGLFLLGIVPMPSNQCYYDTVQKRYICCDRYGLCV
jgi:hypothetical protein